jgi:(p)ppGpp synthase/HD superfamily hydrolase
MSQTNDLVERAKALAYRAHAGQVDKAGRPYIEHVARVAAAVSDDRVCEAVAWLHDVVEDNPVAGADVAEFPFCVELAVLTLTRMPRYYIERAYYHYILLNPIALRVKLADIADNANEERLALLDPKTANRLREKYRKALEALTC